MSFEFCVGRMHIRIIVCRYSNSAGQREKAQQYLAGQDHLRNYTNKSILKRTVKCTGGQWVEASSGICGSKLLHSTVSLTIWRES